MFTEARGPQPSQEFAMVHRPEPNFRTSKGLCADKIKHIAQHANREQALMRRIASLPPHLSHDEFFSTYADQALGILNKYVLGEGFEFTRSDAQIAPECEGTD